MDTSLEDIINYSVTAVANVRTPQLIGLIQSLFSSLLTALLTVIAKIIALIIVKMILNFLRGLTINKTYNLDKEFNFYDVDTNVNNVQNQAYNSGNYLGMWQTIYIFNNFSLDNNNSIGNKD